jgi:hypothetical protein
VSGLIAFAAPLAPRRPERVVVEYTGNQRAGHDARIRRVVAGATRMDAYHRHMGRILRVT